MSNNKFTLSDIPASYNWGTLVFDEKGNVLDVRLIRVDEQLAKLSGIQLNELNGMHLSALFSHLGNGEVLIGRLASRVNLQVKFFCDYLSKEVLFSGVFINDNELLIVISIPEYEKQKVGPTELLSREGLPLKVFFESAYNWEYWVAPNGYIKMTSPSCERITGYKPEEFLINKDLIKQISHPEDIHLLTYFTGNEEHNFEVRIQNKAGEIRWIKHVCRPVFDDKGNFVGRRVSNTDITELKEINAKLEESKRMLQTLISNLPGLVYRCKNDPSWTMEFISHGAFELTGYPPEEFINNNRLTFNDIIHPDHQKRLWDKWQELLKRREPFFDEYPIITASGEIKWVLERGCGVFDESGNLLALEGFIWDNTKFHNLLEDFKVKSQELAAANEMKDKLISVIAHDLKNSLGSLIGYSELLLDDYHTTDESNRLQMIKHMYRSANIADHLLTNLLDWSRLKNGRYQPRIEILDLNAMVSEIILLYRNVANQKQTRIYSLIPPSIYIHNDHYAISTIMRNLISNAIKFTFPGKSVRISVHEESYRYLSVNVEDEGISLNEDEIEAILSPHIISSKPGTLGEKGSGMGLKLSLEFAALIGARINAKPRDDGKGMVFRLILPKQ